MAKYTFEELEDYRDSLPLELLEAGYTIPKKYIEKLSGDVLLHLLGWYRDFMGSATIYTAKAERAVVTNYERLKTEFDFRYPKYKEEN